ncbi:MAG TPA: antibiotic biosynthesis monooxygenase [Acidimicrobiales bacterium]|nr:antibiotic biosynthesis monooxygenase [Acidimicrobiales bacterium]
MHEGASEGEPAAVVVTVFRSRLRPEAGAEYHDTAARMLDLARAMPGFVDFKTFEASDGERVSVITFATLEDQHAWRDHPEHRAAQRLGRQRFYASYSISVGQVVAERHFPD